MSACRCIIEQLIVTLYVAAISHPLTFGHYDLPCQQFFTYMKALKIKPDDRNLSYKDKSFNKFSQCYPHCYSNMAIPSPSWTSVRRLLINHDSGLPDLYFVRRFCILVMISAFITSQGDFTTTQRIVDGLSSLVGIDKKTRWKYISIMLWKASEFGIGWWLDCTGTVHRNHDH
jgi:hypothetical protein